MGGKTTVSVIVSVFNGEGFIRQHVESLLGQTFRDFETVFVVDGRSTDRSVQMAEEACGRLGNARVILQDDGKGLGGARNIGLEAALGELICFTDVDDRLLPDYLEEMFKAQREFDADIVNCNAVWTDSDTYAPKRKGSCGSEVIDGETAIKHLGSQKIIVNTWCKMFRRDFLLDNGLYFISGYHEDVDHTYRAFAKTDRICVLGCELYVYLQHGSSICGKSKMPMAESSLVVFGNLRKRFSEENPDLYDAYRQSSFKNLLHCVALAEYGEYKTLSKDEQIAEDVSDFKFRSFEAFVFRISPWLYYKAVKVVRKFKRKSWEANR